MVGRMLVRSVGGAVLVGSVLAATPAGALSCDDLSHRLQTAAPSTPRAPGFALVAPSRFPAAPASPRITVDARPPYVIARLSDAPEVHWWYGVFARRSDGCRLVGAVDAPDQIGERPSHRLVELPGGRVALAIRAQARGGTGLVLIREAWYLLEERGLAAILDYPVRGHMIGWPSTFDRSFATTAVPRWQGSGVDELEVEFRASYTSGSYIYWMPVESLFTSTRRAYYTWKPASQRFVLDPIRSDIDSDEIEGLFTDAEEQFLRHNVQELVHLAARAHAGQRVWLRQFLDSVPDGPEKRAVMESFQ